MLLLRMFGLLSMVTSLPTVVNATQVCTEEYLYGRTLKDRYLVGKFLQSGSHSNVFSSLYNGQKYALKCILNGTIPMNNTEFEIMKMLDHPHIMSLTDSFEFHGHSFLVTQEYSMDLLEYIIKLERDQIKGVFLQIMDAVVYMHSLGIYHADLKLENILVDDSDDPTIKITDFGLSTFEEYSSTTFRGTTLYIAPEMLQLMPGYSWAKNDVWSLGVILFTMLTKSYPWSQPSMNFSIVEGLQQKHRFSNNFMNVLRDVFGPSQWRPTAAQFKKEIQDLDFFFDHLVI